MGNPHLTAKMYFCCSPSNVNQVLTLVAESWLFQQAASHNTFRPTLDCRVDSNRRGPISMFVTVVGWSMVGPRTGRAPTSLFQAASIVQTLYEDLKCVPDLWDEDVMRSREPHVRLLLAGSETAAIHPGELTLRERAKRWCQQPRRPRECVV